LDDGTVQFEDNDVKELILRLTEETNDEQLLDSDELEEQADDDGDQDIDFNASGAASISTTNEDTPITQNTSHGFDHHLFGDSQKDIDKKKKKKKKKKSKKKKKKKKKNGESISISVGPSLSGEDSHGEGYYC
jgi:hypothetical protein